MANTDILFYKKGSCESVEFIEDDSCGFYNNGTVHCKEFVEADVF